jgi:chitin disaccharide deacetylase
MKPPRTLIVNADDFGQSDGINRGIGEAHQHGIVTSTSIMVRWPSARQAASDARNRPRLSVGLHLDLGEWVLREGKWVARYEVVPPSDAGRVAAEVARQIGVFREMIGCDPSHLDSHQHVHRSEPARSAVLAAAEQLGVPVRHFSAARYCGAFYGQDDKGCPLPEALSPDSLVAILRDLPPGLTELCCHPGYAHDLETAYRAEREIEVRTLCSAQVREALDDFGIRLASFGEAAKP